MLSPLAASLTPSPRWVPTVPGPSPAHAVLATSESGPFTLGVWSHLRPGTPGVARSGVCPPHVQ